MVGFSAATTRALLLIFFSYLATHVASLSFDYSTFSSKDKNTIMIEGDANFSDGWIDISAIKYGSNVRASYSAQPMLLWDKATGEVASFTTRFAFSIVSLMGNKGGGMAFFLTGQSSLPANCPEYNLGLTNQRPTDLASGDNRFVAVEFDTFNNTNVSDPNTYPTDGHIGIDVNSLVSVQTLLLQSFDLMMNLIAEIEYNNVSSILTATVWHGDDKDGQPTIGRIYTLSSEVDLKSSLPEQVFIGFSASTSTSPLATEELHQLHSWSFNSSLEPPSPSSSPPPLPPPPPGQGPGSVVIAGAAIGATMFIVILSAAAATLIMRHRRRGNMMAIENRTDLECADKPMTEIEMGTGPRRFPYQELVEATRNFAAGEKLGQGGFGAVYRGYLTGESGLAVAIKRFSKSKHEEFSMQGEREYKSEIKVISKLRHRNLVQLLGWCHGHGELLLVYELMPNCSLDIHLHSKQGTFLTWPMRMKILLELGSALLYLHEEWEQRVLHRDIKPSNVMLDESFGAKLGDFGLARLVDHAAGMQTMTVISGTPGYLDPECVNTGRASAESDMYSFGVVLLEVASGRRPMSILAAIQDKQMNGGVFRLVEWVWGLYGQGAILEAADEQLKCDYNAAEVERVMVVGLWCAHPNPSARPSIRTAMATLQPKVNQACYQLPVLPSKMPVPMYEPSLPLTWANVVGMSSSSSHTIGMSSSTLSSMPPHTSITTSSDASTSATS